MKQYEEKPTAWDQLVQNTWVYARVSPRQKEFILESLKGLGYVTLMAGDGTNDVGALKAANVGIALLDGTPEDLKKIAEHQRMERMKKVYEAQLNMTRRFNQPPPPVPPALKTAYPDLEKAREAALTTLNTERQSNPSAKFDLSAITSQMTDLDDDGPPQIRLGDASVAAPFTSKLGNVNAIITIIRQGRCTLVAFTQMHKILALNCLISAYSLSVLYLDGIKYGDYQVTISGMLMSVCFLCISRAKPMERLSAQRPLSKVFSLYMLLSVLLQFALHVATTHYLVRLVPQFESQEPVDFEAKFNPSLLNSAIFLIGLSQQVNTFSVNYIGQPHREAMRQNSTLYYGLLACFGVAFFGATELMPELNEWLQLVKLPSVFQVRLVTMMVIDFVGCYIIEWTVKAIFADQQPKALVTKRREGMHARMKARAEKAAASA